MMTIDLNRIRLFVRVVDAGSFTAAAAAAGLPKSSISRAVAALERDLGVRLIQRTIRRVQVTEAAVSPTYPVTLDRSATPQAVVIVGGGTAGAAAAEIIGFRCAR